MSYHLCNAGQSEEYPEEESEQEPYCKSKIQKTYVSSDKTYKL